MPGICKGSVNVHSSASVVVLFQRSVPSPSAGIGDPHMVI